MTPDRERRADLYLADVRHNNETGSLFSDFFQWQTIREDVLHFTPFDSLPREQQDAARRRRYLSFKNSHIPWIASDVTGLLTAIDDLDDLGKSIDFAKAIARNSIAFEKATARRLSGEPRDDAIEAWREACGAPPSPRARKHAFLAHGLGDVLGFLGLSALKALFPEWGLIALALQFAQTTDALFGYGIQLGPVVGLAAELVTRGLEGLGLPFGPETNKYHQINAARVTQKINRTLALAGTIHPDDVMTTVVSGFYASRGDVLPTLVINPTDYPSFTSALTHPWQWPQEGFNAARLAVSIPYNLGAIALNDYIGPMLQNWSGAVGGDPNAIIPPGALSNEQRALVKLTDQGICPGPMCQAELYQDAAVLTNPALRLARETGAPKSILAKAKALGMDIDQVLQTILGL